MAVIELLPFCCMRGLSACGETHFPTPHLPSADCGDQIKTQLNYDCWYAKLTNLSKNMAAQTRKTTLPLSDFTFRQLKLFFFLFFVLGAVENDVA